MYNNKGEHLVWKEVSRRQVFNCTVFSVNEQMCRSPDNTVKPFTVLDAPDWVIVLPLMETERGKNFVMVRQWRHGAQDLSVEFPGGVSDKGETPQEAAVRELEEETAYTAGKLTKLGEFNPNPAIMSNKVHFFLAEDLKGLQSQDLDEDEYVDVEKVPVNDVIKGMGAPPYIHALMGTALSLYLANEFNNKNK